MGQQPLGRDEGGGEEDPPNEEGGEGGVGQQPLGREEGRPCPRWV